MCVTVLPEERLIDGNITEVVFIQVQTQQTNSATVGEQQEVGLNRLDLKRQHTKGK